MEAVIGQNTEAITALPEALQRNIWKPGQSGNPGGRPKRKPFTEALEKLLLANDDAGVLALCTAQIKKGKKGDTKAFTAIRDTVQGAPQRDEERSGNTDIKILIEVLGG